MEIVVDIRDMLAELVRKLWFIVILVIIGAVALGGFKFYKDSKSANAGNTTTSSTQTKLTSAEKVKVDTYVGMKKQFVTVYDESCLAQQTMLVSGGRIGMQIECAPADLIKVTRGRTAAITQEHEA